MRRKPRSPETPADAAFLPEAEVEVLACLHRAGEAQAAEIRRALRKTRPMSHASVVTLLGRLEQRGIVSRRKAESGKAFVWFATHKPEQTFRSVIGRVAERVFHHDRVALVSSLFGAKPPTREELDGLRELLDGMDSDAAPPRRGKGKARG